MDPDVRRGDSFLNHLARTNLKFLQRSLINVELSEKRTGRAKTLRQRFGARSF
jgi:hypothetical protein